MGGSGSFFHSRYSFALCSGICGSEANVVEPKRVQAKANVSGFIQRAMKKFCRKSILKLLEKQQKGLQVGANPAWVLDFPLIFL